MGIVALAGGVVCWGVSPVLIRRLTPFVDAWTANGLRYPIAAVLYWPILWRLWSTKQLTWDLIKRCLIPALLSTLGQVFWSLAHYELQASEIGFYARMSTAWAILGSVALFADERRLVARPRFLIGLAVVATGFVVMSWLPPSSPHAVDLGKGSEPVSDESESMQVVSREQAINRKALPDGNYQLGVIFALLASCFFGTYMVSIRSCVPHENPIHVFGVVGQFVSVGMILGMFVWGDVTSVGNQTSFSWSLIVVSAIMGIACGHVLVYTAVQRLGPSITTSCQSVLPFVTVTVAALALSEQLTVQQWIGGLMMITGALTLLSIKHEISAPTPDSASGHSVQEGIER